MLVRAGDVRTGEAVRGHAAPAHCELHQVKGLDKALRHYNWRLFAAGYNGRRQIEKYAGWLEQRFQKWERILSKPREELTAQDLRDAGSKIIAKTDAAKTAVATAAAAGPAAGVALEAAKGAIEPVTQAVQTAQQAQGAWEWIRDNREFLAVIGLTALFLVACWFAWRALSETQDERARVRLSRTVSTVTSGPIPAPKSMTETTTQKTPVMTPRNCITCSWKVIVIALPSNNPR